jgi:hypothetical protein
MKDIGSGRMDLMGQEGKGGSEKKEKSKSRVQSSPVWPSPHQRNKQSPLARSIYRDIETIEKLKSFPTIVIEREREREGLGA